MNERTIVGKIYGNLYRRGDSNKKHLINKN